MSKSLCIFTFIMIFISLSVWGASQRKGESCRKPSRSIAALDNFHTFCTEGILKISNKLDYFFGGIRVDEEANESYGRVSLEPRFKEGERFKLKTRIRLRMNLPGTEKKIKLVFDKGSDDEDKVVRQTSVSTSKEDKGFDTAIRYVVKRKARANINFDTGMRVRRHRPFNPYMRLRGRFSWEASDKFELRFINNYYYFLRTFGVFETILDFDYSFNKNVLLRLQHFSRWRDRNDYFRFYHTLSLFHEITKDKGINYSIGAEGTNEFKTTYTHYFAHINYRRALYKDWLFLELRPEIRLPKENHFNPELAFSFKIEFLFGRY